MYNFLIDSHCHLNFLIEQGVDIDNIIKSAKNNNVNIINNICTKISEIEDILQLSNKFENVYCSIGQHPEEIENNIITIENLLQYTNNEKVIAIGETGLDYHYRNNNKIEQKKNFETHIEASRISKLPLIIHSREADADMIDILNSEMKNGNFKFVLHCFSSSKELAFKGLDLDGYISFSGILTFKNAVELQDIAKNIPLNKIIIETDSPYLAPVPFRGKINQPYYVKNVAEFLANLLNKDFNNIQHTTTENCLKLFDKIILNK